MGHHTGRTNRVVSALLAACWCCRLLISPFDLLLTLFRTWKTTNFNLLLGELGLWPPVSYRAARLFDPSWTLGGFLYLPTPPPPHPDSSSCLLQSLFGFLLSNQSGTYWLGHLQAGFQSPPLPLVHLASDHFPLSRLWLANVAEEDRERARDYGMRCNPCRSQSQSEFSSLTADRKSCWNFQEKKLIFLKCFALKV